MSEREAQGLDRGQSAVVRERQDHEEKGYTGHLDERMKPRQEHTPGLFFLGDLSLFQGVLLPFLLIAMLAFSQESFSVR